MKVLVLRHLPFEDLSAWAAPLARCGFEIEYADAGLADVAALDPCAPNLVVALGGPIGVNETEDYPFLRGEIDFLAKRIAAGLPTLGTCLGAQLMAAAAGARVYAAAVPEIGFLPIVLTEAGRTSCLSPFADEPVTLQWHGDSFDLPEGAALLATSPAVRNQAFALGEKILAVQFHPEWGAEPLEPWLIGHTVEARKQKLDIPAFRAEAERLRPALAAKAERMIGIYLQRAGLIGRALEE
jgi:GMP synthase (glutamine-hydrolysing)